MSTFAICYEPRDLAAIAAAMQDLRLPNNLRQAAKIYWDAGLSSWSTAPLGVLPGSDPTACTQCVVLVIAAGNKGNLAGLIQLCKDVAAALGDTVSQYLIPLADDMSRADGGKDPYP